MSSHDKLACLLDWIIVIKYIILNELHYKSDMALHISVLLLTRCLLMQLWNLQLTFNSQSRYQYIIGDRSYNELLKLQIDVFMMIVTVSIIDCNGNLNCDKNRDNIWLCLKEIWSWFRKYEGYVIFYITEAAPYIKHINI